MKAAFALLALLISTTCYAEDVKLREEAEQLLERANRVSSPARLPNLERVDTFRVLDSPSGAQEGYFTRVVVQGTGRREEFVLGSYHVLNVVTAGGLSVSGIPGMVPAEVPLLVSLTPIRLVQFDHEDVIQAINESTLDGRPLHCIEFTTTHGENADNNQICVDVASGTLVSMRLGNELIENRDFFPFAGALMPGRIDYSVGGVAKMEIAQTMTELKEVNADVLVAPPDARLYRLCKTFRRAFGENMPQPKPGNGGGDTDILMRGLISKNGTIQDAVVQASERPDLNQDALRTIRLWTFTPAMCDGQAVDVEATFTLHFRSR